LKLSSSLASSLLEKLVCVLEEEFRLCEEFEETLMLEQEHLRNSRAADVEKVSAKKLRLKDRFLEVESRRRKLIIALTSEAGISPKSSLADISGHFSKHFSRHFSGEADRLCEVGLKLKARVVQLRELNCINESLIEKTLFYLRASAGFLNLHTGGLARTAGRVISKEV